MIHPVLDFITKVYWSFQGVQKGDTGQKCVTNLIIIAYRKIYAAMQYWYS